MRYLKFVLVILFILVLVQCTSCKTHNNEGVYYYQTLQDALSDINEECIGRRDKNITRGAGALVTLEKGKVTVCLLKDTVERNTLSLNNINLDLNGFTLTNNRTTLFRTYGTCHIYNGYLRRSCNNNKGLNGVIVGRNSTCTMKNVEFTSDSSYQTNIALIVYGKMYLSHSKISVSTFESTESVSTIAVYGIMSSHLVIEESDITAKSDFGSVQGVYIDGTGELMNSNIAAYSNYQSNEKDFTSSSVGCYSGGTLTVKNCNIYGVHSGINSVGILSVDFGTYSGYGHGGIYCAGTGKKHKITNATILQAEMPLGYHDLGVGCMQGGLYIGGRNGRNNIEVFIDNCIINATKNPIVLRGTSGEINNSLYISNTIINIQHIRVDNDTHCIYLGVGCNFDKLHVDIPDVVIYTDDSYGD